MRRERVRRPGLTGAGITLLVLGLLIGVASGLEISLSIARPLTETFSNPVRQTPVNAPVQLSKGRYVVFELTGQATGDGSSYSWDTTPPTITADQVSVVGSDGALRVTGPGGGAQDTITRQRDVYTGAAYFSVPREGLYQVRVEAPDPVPVIISPSLTSGFFRAWPWFLTGSLSSLSLLIGIVLLILGRRRRVVIRGVSGSAPPGPGQLGLTGPAGGQGPAVYYPPGWYTDPTAAGRMRYWDGHAWVNDAR